MQREGGGVDSQRKKKVEDEYEKAQRDGGLEKMKQDRDKKDEGINEMDRS